MTQTTTKIQTIRTIRADWETIVSRAVAKGATRCKGATLPKAPKILGSSVKTESSKGRKVKTGVAYLSPSIESGYDTCRNASAECRAACLVGSGQLGMSPALNARLWKTALAIGAPRLFRALLGFEIRALVKASAKDGYTPAVRLDGTSDLGLGGIVAKAFPDVQFYDYTKSEARALRAATGQSAPNWHVTFSFSGHNADSADRVLAAGGNVAVAFNARPGIKGRRKADPLPLSWRGTRVIDGDYLNGDARFLDPRGIVVGLRFKGTTKRAEKIQAAGAFVQRVTSTRALPRAL